MEEFLSSCSRKKSLRGVTGKEENIKQTKEGGSFVMKDKGGEKFER